MQPLPKRLGDRTTLSLLRSALGRDANRDIFGQPHVEAAERTARTRHRQLDPAQRASEDFKDLQNMNKELSELFAMLKSAEIEIKKEHQVLMVNRTTSFKKQGKSKGKFKKGGKKAATPPMKPKTGPKPDAECYYCKEKGHWKRNCSKYLADLKSGLVKKKKEDAKHVDARIIDTFVGNPKRKV
ncbi:hypothetical protein QYE76_004378 [Lolium multiflorum]|uniref:CCHC-type domain-containing protein n=1 Tax=Lolium multiflorum TaxID=4521 RepID=A0AAD8W264_LOLMU|nr:hypothetical protein QYE76_004378 [Lolium multiflorum]